MSKRNPICAGGFLKNLTRCCLAAVPGTQQPQHTAPVIYGIEVREHRLLCLTQSAKSALKLEQASVRLASAVTTALQHEGIAEPTVDYRSFCRGQQSWMCIDTAACNTSSILQAFGLILGFKLSERIVIFSVSRQQSGVSCGLTQHHYFHRICRQREIHCCRYRRTSKKQTAGCDIQVKQTEPDLRSCFPSFTTWSANRFKGRRGSSFSQGAV